LQTQLSDTQSRLEEKNSQIAELELKAQQLEKEKQDQNNQLQTQLSDTQSRLEEKNSQIAELELKAQQLQEEKTQNNQLQTQLSDTQARLEEKNSQIAELELKAQQLEKEKQDQNNQLQTQLSDTRTLLEQKSNLARDLALKLQQAEADRNENQQKMADLRMLYENLEKENQQLAQKSETLNVEFEKINSVVELKEKNIREIDEAKRRLESSLQAQLAAQADELARREKLIAELDHNQGTIASRLKESQDTANAQAMHIKELEDQVKEQAQRVEEQNTLIAALDETKIKLERRAQAQIEARESRIKEQEKIIADLDRTRRQLEAGMQEQILAQQIKLEEMEGKLKVTLIDKILFDSGRAEINAQGQALLLKLADTLNEYQDQTIMIEGHTDNVQIGPELKAKYPTNWELSTARSTAVLRFLQDKAGVDPERCTVCGYSFYRPVASNETAEGRRRNRRIEIILAPKQRPVAEIP
ncbi:MAG: OmpA family protein, partial [Desulfobacterales bacterium]